MPLGLRLHGLDLGRSNPGYVREDVLGPVLAAAARLREDPPIAPGSRCRGQGSFRQKQPPEIVGSGYVVESLEAALWAFHDAKDFREAVLRAVNLGDDADTTGAVCGSLPGRTGASRGFRQEWREGLARPEMIEKAFRGLVETAVSSNLSCQIKDLKHG